MALSKRFPFGKSEQMKRKTWRKESKKERKKERKKEKKKERKKQRKRLTKKRRKDKKNKGVQQYREKCLSHIAIFCSSGTMLSFVWPCLFHIRLRGRSLPVTTIVFDVVIVIIGLACGIVGMYYSAKGLFAAIVNDAQS